MSPESGVLLMKDVDDTYMHNCIDLCNCDIQTAVSMHVMHIRLLVNKELLRMSTKQVF